MLGATNGDRLITGQVLAQLVFQSGNLLTKDIARLATLTVWPNLDSFLQKPGEMASSASLKTTTKPVGSICKTGC